MFDLWFKHWRRRRLMRTPPPPHWSRILEESLWPFRVLSDEKQLRLLRVCQIFLGEKQLEGCRGLELTETMRLTIAGAAGLMLLGFNDDYCFDRVRTILVYPGALRLRGGVGPVGGLVSPDPWVSGVYTAGDTIVLSWDDVVWECRHPESRSSVVIHEFAHHVDDLDGSLAGDPPFASGHQSRQWQVVMHEEYERLAYDVRAGMATVLRPDALTNFSEFFAVACESYYCDALQLASCHPELFGLLQSLFQYDPRDWFAWDRDSLRGG